jgi:hypothetical protein
MNTTPPKAAEALSQLTELILDYGQAQFDCGAYMGEDAEKYAALSGKREAAYDRLQAALALSALASPTGAAPPAPAARGLTSRQLSIARGCVERSAYDTRAFALIKDEESATQLRAEADELQVIADELTLVMIVGATPPARAPYIPGGVWPFPPNLERPIKKQAPATGARTIEPFVVKHYSEDERPTLKGNGFDGLEIGSDREEAEQFVAFVNYAVAAMRERCAKLCEEIRDRYRRLEGLNYPELKTDAETGASDCMHAILDASLAQRGEGS